MATEPISARVLLLYLPTLSRCANLIIAVRNHSGRNGSGPMGSLWDNLSTHCQTRDFEAQGGFQSREVVDLRKAKEDR
ncbi:hypothetical protein BDP55DRAFT_641474 [Colletotrichum godetiae]|uniref:Uncharacterized protein n=1 Tax=Colletotrichum godetiae TaxID=1209918 RepID=A0AAJ0F5F6_9PEZI|nr:uncharacterized protein BDP55DRAFT_641474 [Colletotrichum godetiae]KAK1701403.1 hypothetical protein BDP55DRAFT_641474 [Colletotrichum godetiae]